MSGTATRLQPIDEAVPGFEELMGPPVPGPLLAVYDEAGSRLDSVSRIQATWYPAKQLTVRYRVSASGGDLPGRRDVVAMIGKLPDGAALVTGEAATVAMWVVPDDPVLPGLRSALDVATVDDLLAGLGSASQVVATRLRAYRPGRRAVVEVMAGRSSLFLKVVPPAEVASLHARHRFLSDFISVPDSIGVDNRLGIVVMRALEGVDLRTVLRDGSAEVPSPDAVAGMIENLPEPPSSWKTRSPIAALGGITELLRRLLPDTTGRIDRLVDNIGEETSGDRVAVHGDFHEAQVIVDAGHPLALIDVDTYGWGRRGDDAATMLGHLHLLAPECRDPAQVIDVARSLNRYWDERIDPVDLRLRTAAVVLGLATGPFRVQRPNWPAETLARIAVAEQWVESAMRLDERSLIPTSDVSHVGAAPCARQVKRPERSDHADT